MPFCFLCTFPICDAVAIAAPGGKLGGETTERRAARAQAVVVGGAAVTAMRKGRREISLFAPRKERTPVKVQTWQSGSNPTASLGMIRLETSSSTDVAVLEICFDVRSPLPSKTRDLKKTLSYAHQP